MASDNREVLTNKLTKLSARFEFLAICTSSSTVFFELKGGTCRREIPLCDQGKIFTAIMFGLTQNFWIIR
jgi:hypothetical protein